MSKYYRNIYLSMAVLFFCVFTARAQNTMIKGHIKDETGSNVPGANIVIKGTTSGTTSDADGNFSILASPNDVLVVTFIGYKTLEVVPGNQTSLDLTIEVDLTTLTEVIVVGYGEQKKGTLSGSVAVVSGSEIIKSAAINVSNNLAGRLPGLTAITPSSEPGNDDAILRIRGVGTFGNANPLIVVDGIPNRSLNRLDPATIESISVLKDASAAIYGAQAANGVILITTKKGKAGAPSVNATFNYGFGRPTRIPEMASATEYATMLNEIATYAGNAAPYTDEEIEKFSDGSDPWRYPNTDWFKETLKPWSGQTYGNISLNGGSEAIRYFVSASRRTQEGFYYNSGTKYNQYDFRMNLDSDIGKYFTLGIGLLGRMEDRNYPMRDAGSIFRMVMRGKPTLPAYWPNGLPGPDIEYGDNPVVVSTKATGYDQNKINALNSNLKLGVKIPWVDGLTLTTNLAFDKQSNFRKQWATPWYLYTWDGQTVDADGNPVVTKSKKGYDSPRLNQDFGDIQNVLINGLLNYQKKFGDNDVAALFGIERITGNNESFQAGRRNFPSTSLDQLFAGAVDDFLSNYGTASNSARLNYFGRVNYAFKSKILAEFVWRYQGSYIFEESSRFGFFPGVSVGYVLSEENFWNANTNFVNYFKVRASWGQTGNDLIDPYQYLAVYNAPTSYNNGNPLSFNDGEKLNLALSEAVLSNRNTSWEVATQRNIGIDAELMDGKIAIVADYFSNLRDDILWWRNASVPGTAGVTLPRENIGETKNNGFDFSIDYRNSSGNLTYSVGLNGGYARNEITFWDEAPGAPDYQRSTGAPIDARTYYEAIGIFQDEDHVNSYPHMANARPGDVIFKDVNADGAIDANDMVRSDRTNVPRWNGGLNIALKYKGFDFSALFQGAAGGQTYIMTESGTIGNYLKSFYDERWTEERPSTSGPRAFDRSNEYWASLQNTNWIHKTDYVRLKNIELGYSLPSSLSQRIKLQNIRIYVNAYNLLTYSPDMEDFDPELSNDVENQSTSGQGYPLQKIINTGISVTF
jgi:TonB-dependent starch-binding outer membrane protein SusC